MKLNPFRPDLVEEQAQGQQHTSQLAEGYVSLPVCLPHVKTTLLMKINKIIKTGHSCCTSMVKAASCLKLNELSCCRLLF